MLRFLTPVLFILFTFAAASGAFSQDAGDTDVQFWNDLQVSIPLNKNIDLQLLSTARFGEKISRFEHGRIGAGISASLGKGFSAGANYQLIESRNSQSRFTTEHRYTFRGGYKFPVKRFGLSHRSTYEYRVRSGSNSWRYRAALTIEKKLPDNWIKDAEVFLTEEAFYVSTAGRFSRNRVSAGVSKKINSNLTLDLYYMRQNDGTSQRGDLHVIGTAWRVHL
jgi:hypothetical protein